MILKNIDYLADDFTMHHGSIATDGMLFSCAEEADASECFDLSGFFTIPGLIDLHFHGAVNADVRDGCAASLEKIAAFEAFSGMTAICPATVSFRKSAETESAMSMWHRKPRARSRLSAAYRTLSSYHLHILQRIMIRRWMLFKRALLT